MGLIHRQNVLPHKLAGIISHLPVWRPSLDTIRAEFRKTILIGMCKIDSKVDGVDNGKLVNFTEITILFKQLKYLEKNLKTIFFEVRAKKIETVS